MSLEELFFQSNNPAICAKRVLRHMFLKLNISETIVAIDIKLLEINIFIIKYTRIGVSEESKTSVVVPKSIERGQLEKRTQ